jgi:hypothetical protein
MDKNKNNNLWFNIGFPINIANILKFLMLELKGQEPRLFGDCVRKLFSEESFDLINIDIYLLKSPKRKDERTYLLEQVQQKMNCFFEHVIIESIDENETYNFLVINSDNLIKFNIYNNFIDTIFDVNNLSIDYTGNLHFINETQSYTLKNKIKDKIHWTNQNVSIIETIKNCKKKEMNLCWSGKKLKSINVANALIEWSNMIKKGWSIRIETNKHIVWSLLEEKIDCSICQDEEVVKPCVKLGCGHKFHIDCINKVFQSDNLNKKCPLDRQDISPFIWHIELINKKKITLNTIPPPAYNIPDESDMFDL